MTTLLYLGRRAVSGLIVIVGVVAITFVIARLIPGDPASAWVGYHATPSELAQARHTLGLDQPLPVQLWDYIRSVLTGNWGTAIHTKQPVLSDIAEHASASIELVGSALILAWLLGIPLGLVSARWPGGAADVMVRLGAVAGVSMPVFWLGLILQLIFFQRLGWLPVAGEYDSAYATVHLVAFTHVTVIDALLNGNFGLFANVLDHLILPALVVASYPIGLIARMVRASVLDVLGDDYIRMARALGFPERSVFLRFALRPALNPIIAVTALVLAYSLTNTFLVEAIFDWPGLGSYAAASIQSLDTPAIVGLTLIVASVYVFGNLAVDLAQAVVDPRIRLS